MSDWNAEVIEEFRSNEGRVGGPFQGAPLLLLHTTGVKTGKERINPLMYRKYGDRFAIFASKGGAPSNPDWYRNLLANLKVKIEVGTQTIQATARVAQSEERERLWTAQKREYPTFATYEANTKRQIPVVILDPVAEKVSARGQASERDSSGRITIS